MFQRAHIQLPTEEQPLNTATSRPSALIKRSSSNWSIPCCSNFSIRGQRIQLPDDSDSEDEQREEFIINNTHLNPSPTMNPFTMNSESANNGNSFIPHASQLSRNPFARVTTPEEESLPASKKSIVPEASSETLPIETEVAESSSQKNLGEQGEEEEELADFTTHAADKYANEPDWTEMYQDDNSSVEEIIPTVEDTQQRNIPTITQEIHIAKTPSITSQSSIKGEEEAEEIEETSPKLSATEAEKIPQIDEQVLHHLPLPQLSKEIPPTLIHKKASFEKSMYGEQPLMSISSTRPTNRISRFSMTEEDFLKLKKKEEEEKKNMHKLITPPAVVDPVQEAVTNKVVDVPFVAEASTHKTDAKEHQEGPVTQQQERRSSIVATAAHSILGDKLDDFTEKLAFIKKNIIMSIDSDDDEDIEEADDAKTTLQKIAQMSNENNNFHKQTATRPPNHRRASSLMDVGPTIARFMNQISGTNNNHEEKRQVTPTTTTSTSFSPSSLFSALAGPDPTGSATHKPTRSQQQQGEDEEEEEEEDEEDLFDFTKVIEIGKNVKSFSEGVVGNGIRMFNDVATRMKHSTDEDDSRQTRRRSSSVHKSSVEDNDSHWLNDSYI